MLNAPLQKCDPFGSYGCVMPVIKNLVSGDDLAAEFFALVGQMTLPELERLYREGCVARVVHQNACNKGTDDLQYGYLDDSLPDQQSGRIAA